MNLKPIFLRLRWIAILCFAVLATIGSTWMARALAQASTAPWSEPANLSQSGAASQPIIVAAPDGTLHVLWWDSIAGEQSAHTTSITSTAWTSPVAVPVIFGERKIDSATGREIATAPRETRLVASTNGGIHALWLDSKDQLLTIQSDGSNWGNKTTSLAEEASVFDAESDISGTLHLAYVRPADTADAPAGLYYRANTGADWSAAKLIHDSPYFRSAQPSDISLSVAGDGSGRAMVVWTDPRTGQSVYARTSDGGTSWSTPQDIAGIAGIGRAQRGRIATTAGGQLLLIWQDSSAGGCGFIQSQSADAGQTWSAPQKVLSDATHCNEQWTFSHSSDGRLWALGRPAVAEQSATTNAVSAAAWDGSRWSDVIDVALSSYDRTTGRSNGLNCIGITVAGAAAGIVGCDPSKDIWAARNAVPLSDLVSTAKPVWDPVEVLSTQSDFAAVKDLPALVADEHGNVYAIWSQPTRTGNAVRALYGATGTNQRWSRATLLLRSQASNNEERVAVQPAITLDGEGKIHAVWSSGTNGPVNYSWVYARDFGGSANWAEPIALPAATAASSWPAIAVDSPANAVYVIYAIPYNEQRGIYLGRSIDNGATWLTPTIVFDAAAAKWDSADKPQIVFDEQSNVLHAAWLQTALPDSTNNQAVYYARSTDQGQTWSVPVRVAEGNVDWPRLSLFGTDKIYLAWTESASQAAPDAPTPYGVWGQYSLDGGQQWSSTAAVPDFEQVSGAISLSGNGSGQLYLAAVSQSTGGESSLALSRWTGLSWSDHELLGLAQPARSGNAAVIFAESTAGRLSAIMRLWMLGQDNQGQSEIAGTGREIERATVVPAPTFTPMPTMPPRPTATLEPTPTLRPQLTNSERQPSTRSQGAPPLLLGGLLAAVIVIFIAASMIFLQRRR